MTSQPWVTQQLADGATTPTRPLSMVHPLSRLPLMQCHSVVTERDFRDKGSVLRTSSPFRHSIHGDSNRTVEFLSAFAFPCKGKDLCIKPAAPREAVQADKVPRPASDPWLTHTVAGPALGAPAPCRAHRTVAYLRDAWVRALAVGARQLQPLALVDGAVLPQGALALSLAPAALEVWVRLEAQAAALTHGSALIEVNCVQRAGMRRGWGLGGAGKYG